MKILLSKSKIIPRAVTKQPNFRFINGVSMKDQSFDNLFRKYYNEALLYTCSFTHNLEVAEDIVSEAYLRAIKTIDEQKDGFKYWLLKVCRNCYFDYYKKAKRLAPIDDSLPSDEFSLADRVIQKEEYKALYAAIQELDERYREVVTLYYFNGLTQKEISDMLGISSDNVKILLFRARNKLKQSLEAKYEF